MSSRTLTSLYINNNISDESLKPLAEVFRKNSTITLFSLTESSIGCKGASRFANALKENNSLKYLWLDNNEIGDDGTNELAEMLTINSSLILLGLSNNNVSVDGALQLSEALQVNSSLRYLDWENNPISDLMVIDFVDYGIQRRIAEVLSSLARNSHNYTLRARTLKDRCWIKAWETWRVSWWLGNQKNVQDPCDFIPPRIVNSCIARTQWVEAIPTRYCRVITRKRQRLSDTCGYV